jgi:hypothetical protein
MPAYAKWTPNLQPPQMHTKWMAPFMRPIECIHGPWFVVAHRLYCDYSTCNSWSYWHRLIGVWSPLYIAPQMPKHKILFQWKARHLLVSLEFKCCPLLSTYIPHNNRLIKTAREQEFPVRVPRQTADASCKSENHNYMKCKQAHNRVPVNEEFQRKCQNPMYHCANFQSNTANIFFYIKLNKPWFLRYFHYNFTLLSKL